MNIIQVTLRETGDTGWLNLDQVAVITPAADNKEHANIHFAAGSMLQVRESVEEILLKRKLH